MRLPIGILMLAFVFLWNSGFIGAELVLPYAGPFTQLFWRYLFIALGLFVFIALSGQLSWPGWKTAGGQCLTGVLSHAVWLSAVLVALDQGVDAGVVALIVATQPLWTGAFSKLVTGESTSLRRWIGLGIGFAGVLWTVSWRMESSREGSGIFYLLPLLAALSMASATLFQRRLELSPVDISMPLWPCLFYQSAASALVLLPFAGLLEGLATEWTTDFILGLSWLAIAVSLGGYAAMWTLLTQVDTSRVASLFYLGPPVTFFMAWLIFSDPLLWSDSLGLGIVVLGVTLSQLGDQPKASSRSTSSGSESHSPGGLHPQQEPSA